MKVKWKQLRLQWSLQKVWQGTMGSPWGKNHQSQEFHIFPKQEITLKTCCTQPMGNVSMLRVMIDFKEQQLGHQSITLPVIGDLEGAYSFLPGSLSCTIQIYSFMQGWRAVPSWLPWASLPEGAVRRGKLVGPVISLLAVVDLGYATGCHLLLHPLSILSKSHITGGVTKTGAHGDSGEWI